MTLRNNDPSFRFNVPSYIYVFNRNSDPFGIENPFIQFRIMTRRNNERTTEGSTKPKINLSCLSSNQANCKEQVTLNFIAKFLPNRTYGFWDITV